MKRDKIKPGIRYAQIVKSCSGKCREEIICKSRAVGFISIPMSVEDNESSSCTNERSVYDFLENDPMYRTLPMAASLRDECSRHMHNGYIEVYLQENEI